MTYKQKADREKRANSEKVMIQIVTMISVNIKGGNQNIIEPNTKFRRRCEYECVLIKEKQQQQIKRQK